MRVLISLFFFLAFFSNVKGQDLEKLFFDVDTVFLQKASAGNLTIIDSTMSTIISNSFCNEKLDHFSAAGTYVEGKVLMLGHEALLVNDEIDRYDNLKFLENAFEWLGGTSKSVSLLPGWVNEKNSSRLSERLKENGFSFRTLLGELEESSLFDTDILVLGNDWNDMQPYSNSQLSLISEFVSQGGGLLITGLGWSWPGDLNSYPMNQVAKLFGGSFDNKVITDQFFNENGFPKFFNFFPENSSDNSDFYCQSQYFSKNISRGENLRILRLAVSSTGEFTTESGGVSNVETLIEDWLTEINIIYGREYSVRFELIENNKELIFPDSDSDPWGDIPQGSAGCENVDIIFRDQKNVIDSIIGEANYDISHVILSSSFNGGCAGSFKTGVSGSLNLAITRHELGHQFSQSHTINFSNNTNYEPENGGWTIQGGNKYGYAHAVSFYQLADFLVNREPKVGFDIETGNNIPVLESVEDRIIPINTPFILKASAIDIDENDSLTYVWDNMSPGIAQEIPVSDDTQGALFMRLLPDTSSTRIFPIMQDVLNNRSFNDQEQLPTSPRFMDFRLTVNDNHKINLNGLPVNASGSVSNDFRITVADAGPFKVVSQSSKQVEYIEGTKQEVKWEVNGTDLPPINTKYVSISLSIDGGITYPILLSDSVDNNGSALIELPNLTTNKARIKVASMGNIFFDVNENDFKIVSLVSSINKSNNENTVTIWPNPVKNILNISTAYYLNYAVRIYSGQGKLKLASKNLKYLDLSNFPSGLYYIVIQDNLSNDVCTKKVVVAK